MEKQILKLYHGSPSIVRIPDLSLSRKDIDFGKGFYMTENIETAGKWACRTASSICNEYTLTTNGLKIHQFKLDKEWLDYIVRNRTLDINQPSKYDDYDVLIGPIADDRLFHTIDLYEDGLISSKDAIKVMNCMNYGTQYVLKTEKAINNLQCLGHIPIAGKEKDLFTKKYREDREEGTRRATELIRAVVAGKEI